jgi:hypothetical protein
VRAGGWAPRITNDWINYLFDNQNDVLLDGKAFMSAVLARQNPSSHMEPQVFLLNWANIRGGPLLIPDYVFDNLSLKISRAPAWRERVHLFDHSGSSGLYITAKAHIGLVTFDNQSLTHDLYGLRDRGPDVPLARLAPETWGPEGVRMRLGADDRTGAI